MNRYYIGHLLASNFFGGPEKQIVTHARLLDNRIYHFALISFVENGQQNELLHQASQAGIATVELHTDYAFDLKAILKLRKILKERGINLLCSHGYKSNVIGRLATWGADIPHVAVSRGWTAENRKIRFYEMLDKIFLRFADRVVAVSEGQRQKILKLGISPDRVLVIHNAIDIEFAATSRKDNTIRKELGIPDVAIFVASAGRLSPEKNHAAMIEAASIVCAHNKDVYFAVFGEGFLRTELENQIKQAGLADRFFLPGFRKDIQNIFHEIDIFMLPSFTEGLPNVVLEAFAARKPVVATSVGGTPEVVQDGVSGFLSAPDEVRKMADQLILLAQSPELRETMGFAGYEYVKEHFSFEKQTIAYEEMYKTVTESLSH